MLEIILVIITSVISKITGLFRELSLAYNYGTSSLSDVYLISITITTTISGFITPAINAAYIPHSNRIEKEENYVIMTQYTRSLLIWLLGSSFLLIILGEMFPEFIVQLFASGFDGEQIKACSLFTRYTVIAVTPLLLISVVSGYLQNHNKALLVSIVPIVENTVVILSIIISKKHNVLWMPIGYTIGGIIAAVSLIIGAHKNGFRFSGSVSLFSSDIIYTMKRMLPVVIGASATQINTLVDRTLASTMGEGSISVLYYADRIVGLIIGIVVLAPLTIVFPKMSKCFINKGRESFYKVVNEINCLLIILCLFGSFCLFFYNKTIIRIIFARGAFQEESIAYTGIVLGFYSLGLLGYALREFITRVYYSENNYRIPFYNSLISVCLNIVLDFVLGKLFGAIGLALATAISAYIAVVIMLFLRRKKEVAMMTRNRFLRIMFVLIPVIVFLMMCYMLRKTESLVMDFFELLTSGILFIILSVIFKPFQLSRIRKMIKDV